MLTPCAFNPGSSWASAASTARVADSVLAPYWLASDNSTPGLPLISASPDLSAGARAHGQDRVGDRLGIGRGHRGLDQDALMGDVKEARALQRQRGPRRVGQ